MNKSRWLMLIGVTLLSLLVVGLAVASDTNQGTNPDSLSGSYIVFDPSVGGDTSFTPGDNQIFCFRAESWTDDYEYVYNRWLKFPTDWVVNNVYVVGTPVCDGGSWGTFSWSFETAPYEINIDHDAYQSTTDHCVSYYCVDVISGAAAPSALESWYFDGDGYGSGPHHPCSDDGYTPASMGAYPCDEAVYPQAEIPGEDIGACTPFTEDFESWPPDGWDIVNYGGTCQWESTATTGRTNYTGGAGAAADADSDWCGSGTTTNTGLLSPEFSLEGATSPSFYYRLDYNDIGSDDIATVDISLDGGDTWTNLVTYTTDVSGPADNTIDLSAYIGEPSVRLRFGYFLADWDWWFEVDDAALTCGAAGTPDIEVTPLALSAEQPTDTQTTQNLQICNVGDGDLTWNLEEIPGVIAGSMPFVPVSTGPGKGNAEGISVSSPGTGVYAPTAPVNPKAVLWDQPLSAVNINAYVNQNFTDLPTYSSYLADDFQNAEPWSIGTIFVPGDGWNGFSSLMNASALTWQIYEDAGGVPAGNPSGGTPPIWTLTLPPSDPQVSITTGTSGYPSNTTLTLAVPIALPPGNYWFVFYPDLPFSGGGQYGRQAADTVNGYYGQFINPGGAFGFGTNWQSWTVLGVTQHDIAFRFESGEPVVGIPWLSEDPVSGTTPGGSCTDVTVTFDSTGLAPDTYLGTLEVVSNDPDEPEVDVAVDLTVTGGGGPADILLVDDDDNSPDVQSYYTEALDFLGLAYDVWDTANTDDEPDATTLAAYDAVIWFSGDEFGGFAGPGAAGENALAAWLSGNFADSSSGQWLYKNEAGVLATSNTGTQTLAHPASYRWTSGNPDLVNVLVYADDYIHFAPNTFTDQALQALGMSYTAFYDSDFTGFEAALAGGGWDLVIFADENYAPPESTFTALNNYALAGGQLIFTSWQVGSFSGHPLFTTLGITYVADDYGPANTYWWDEAHPFFTNPNSVPEYTSLSMVYGIYGQYVEPLAGFAALAGFTTDPATNQANMVYGNDGRTLFKGFVDGDNDADLDTDGMKDGLELWINMISNIGGGVGAQQSCLLLSAQDYLYDRGLTAFGMEYLGIANFDSDVSQTEITGAGSVYTGLGPWTMVYPGSDYSDWVVPDGTAEVSFLGDEVGALETGLDKFGATYFTTFLSFQLEGVPDVSDRAEVISTFLSVECQGPSVVPEPDIAVTPTTITHEQPMGAIETEPLTIANEGGALLTWTIDEDEAVSRAPIASDSVFTGENSLAQSDAFTVTAQNNVVRNPNGDINALINDGSFEFGPPPASAWTEVSDQPCEWIGDWTGVWGVPAYDGFFDYWAGGYCGGIPTTSHVSQLIPVPTTGTTLSFWYISYRPDPDDGGDYAYITVDGTTVWTLDLTQANDTYPNFVNATVDLSAYAGMNVTLEFGAVSAGASTGNIRFDFIEFAGGPVACQSPVDVPWLSVVPDAGSTDPGASTVVDVYFDSTALVPGTYSANLCVNSNDPDEPLVVVPVTLDVVGAPDIAVDPASLEATLLVDQTETQQLNVCNEGDSPLNWSLAEVEYPKNPLVVLYDNGPLVTHPGGGFGGADASALQTALGLTIYGFGAQYSAGNRMADDFTITDPAGWSIDQISFFTYQTGSPTAPSPITAVYFQIWNGPPDDPTSSVVFGDLTTNRLASTSWSNMYRVLDTDMLNTARPPMLTVATAGVVLPPGTYWIDYNFDGSTAFSGPWAPPISILGQTSTGNAMQWTGAWAPALDGTFQQGMPFIVEGNIIPSFDLEWLTEDPTSGTVLPGECGIVDVTFDSTGLAAGTYTGALEVSSNDPDEPVVTVPVTLNVVAGEPDIVVTAPPLELTLYPNETGVIPFTIGNEGALDLTWSLVDSAAWLTVAPTSGTIVPAGETTVNVTFNSTGLGVGTFTGTITITSNDPDEPTITLNVTLHVVPRTFFLPFITKYP